MMTTLKKYSLFLFGILLASSCSPAPKAVETATPFFVASPVSLTVDAVPQLTEMPDTLFATEERLPEPTVSLTDWTDLPVVPFEMSDRVREIYKHGLELGNNPNRFIKVGDCDATVTWFLGDFDLGPRYYSLGEYEYLQETIDYFHGSFGRESIAVKRGFNAASVLSPIWADHELCEKNETPLACEVRIQMPLYAFVMIGTNDIHRVEQFETNLEKIINYLIEHGVVPILVTKADNLEGDHRINQIISNVAQDYELPIWNYWRAVQTLPDQGLQEDGAHLTFAANKFDNPVNMRAAWPWRNLTALQVLDFVRTGLSEEP